jgi:VanZ family protein
MIRSGLSGQLEHVLAYMLTGLALMIGYPGTPPTRIALGLSAYAAALEVGQLFAPARHASAIDWAGSASGLLAAWLLAMIGRRLVGKRRPAMLRPVDGTW